MKRKFFVSTIIALTVVASTASAATREEVTNAGAAMEVAAAGASACLNEAVRLMQERKDIPDCAPLMRAHVAAAREWLRLFREEIAQIEAASKERLKSLRERK